MLLPLAPPIPLPTDQGQAGNLLSLANIGVMAYDANNKYGFR